MKEIFKTFVLSSCEKRDALAHKNYDINEDPHKDDNPSIESIEEGHSDSLKDKAHTPFLDFDFAPIDHDEPLYSKPYNKDNSSSALDSLGALNLFNYEDDGYNSDSKTYDTPLEPIKDSEHLISNKDNIEDSKEYALSLSSEELDNLRSVFKTLDDLFINLPDEVIREFTMSSMYIRYNNLLDKLGI